MCDMETTSLARSPSSEPPYKRRRMVQSKFNSMTQACSESNMSQVTILQRIKTTLDLAKDETNTLSQSLYTQVDKNLTIFNLDGCEFLAVNATPTEILQWRNLTLPYQRFWVRNTGERRNAIIRAGVMLAGLYGLPLCAVGITVDPLSCSSTESHYEFLTELRRSIWHFILAEVQQIPPHIKSYLEAEMELEAIEFKALSATEITHKQTLDKPGQNSIKQVIQKF